MLDTSFPEILRRLREERNLTQADLAGNSISRALVSLYESGRRTPTYETLAYLAERLQVTVDIFFGSHNDVFCQAKIPEKIVCFSPSMRRGFLTLFHQRML
ncbi:Helix-turn-helix domain-containing protein, partial [Alicyclobacillus hesperidum]